MAYWQRTGAHTYHPTRHVGGSWDLATQHIAPAMGLLVHEIERDLAVRRDDALVFSRLSYDILGTVPLAETEVTVEVLRAGRTIELVQATAHHGGRRIMTLRAWLVQTYDTSSLAGTTFGDIAAPADVAPWPMGRLWQGGFIASLELRRHEHELGHATCWVRTGHQLIEDEPVSRMAAVAGLIDVTNGIAVRADPTEVAFPNLDLTAHLFRPPGVGWLGLDTRASFGANGTGTTATVLYDEQGPLGTIAQTLTVRP